MTSFKLRIAMLAAVGVLAMTSAGYAAEDAPAGTSVCDQGGGRMGPCGGMGGVGLKADAPVSSSVCDQGGGRMGPCAGSGVGLKADAPVSSSVCDQGGGRMGPCAGAGVGLKNDAAAPAAAPAAPTADKK